MSRPIHQDTTNTDRVLQRMNRCPSTLSLSEIVQGSGLNPVDVLDALWELEQQGKVEPRYWRLTADGREGR